MEEIQARGVKKYLDVYYGDMITSDLNGKYKVYSKKNPEVKIFLYEEKHNLSYVNSKYLIDPILKVFQTEYNETYDFVKEWFEKKYDYNCDDLIGF
jgi:hypothetical protein